MPVIISSNCVTTEALLFMKKIRIGVLMGGKSIEREVSFNSGRTVCDHLDTHYYEVIPLFQSIDGTLYLLPWQFIHRGKISDFEHRLSQEATPIIWDDLKEYVDFVFIAMHGEFAEDGCLQGLLEILQIPYLGSGVLPSALGMNKIIQKEILAHNGISVANGISVSIKEIEQFKKYEEAVLNSLTKKNISLPYIVKPCHAGSSLGVRVVTKKEQLYEALLAAYQVNPRKKQDVLIEEKIEGMEFSCVCLYDRVTQSFIALPPTEVVPKDNTSLFDYEQKYMPGNAIEFTPARCSQETLEKIKQTCLHVTKVLEMTTLSRIDGFVSKQGEIIIVDPNSFSGLSPASFVFREAAEHGMHHADLINHLIESSLHHYGLLKNDTNATNKEILMNKKTMRIAVLMGGRSNEKETSLESGRNVVYKLSSENYEVIPLFVDSNLILHKLNHRLLVRNSTVEIEHLLDETSKIAWSELPAIVDFVFIALHGGEGENGCIQGMLEMFDLPYNGSGVLTSALCMDKYKTNSFLKNKGFNVPDSILISREEWLTDKEKTVAAINATLHLPVIIKPHDDGCSVMVQKIAGAEELTTALSRFFETEKNSALIEEYITGMELTVGVIGNDTPHALPPSQAIASHDILSTQEKFLPGAGENQTPAPLSAAALKLVQHTMESVYSALLCKGYARIDCFYQDATQSKTGSERIVILEINTLPALTPATCIFHQAAEFGISPRGFITTIIKLGLEHHAKIVDSKMGSSLITNFSTEDKQIELP
ncbi:MAG: ATP-grasp domain-containing protein [Candidatus Dependentiae bacterium]|nr:ATP-grasp domain-containing protein [Candidatus Dependentiae bacterium]